MARKKLPSKSMVHFLIFSFILLITTEAMPREANVDVEGEFKPVVRVREGGKGISPAQKERFEKLISEGKQLFLEEMDYAGALRKFKEAENLAVTRSQKADVYFYLSLAYYAFQEEESTEKSIEMMRMLIEIDYYRELDKLLCPPKYLDLFLETKAEYGVLRIQSKPSGADVYLDAKRVPEGKTPLTIGHKAGSVDVRVRKGSKEKKDTLTVYAGGETTSPVYKLGGGSSALLILGGLVLAGGVGLALALGKKGNGDGTSEPTTGSIQINSTPTGASVYLDGSGTGRTTNCTLFNVSPGSHSLRLELELYGKWEGNAQVTAGQTTQINATLAPFKYEFVTKWGSRGSGNRQFNNPNGIAVDKSGNVYIADAWNGRIQICSTSGNFLRRWYGFSTPRGVAVDESGNVYVTNQGSDLIQKLSSNGAILMEFGGYGSGNGRFDEPFGIAVDRSGYIYVADRKNNRVQKFDSNGNFVTKWSGFDFPRDVAVDNSGNVYVVDKNNHRIRKFNSSGTHLTSWGSQGSGDGQFSNPSGVAVDKSENVYVTDTSNHRVQKFRPDGDFTIKWGSEGSGNGQFDNDIMIAVDDSGNVYVSEYGNHRIQKFRITTETLHAAKVATTTFNNQLMFKRNFGPKLPRLRASKDIRFKNERRQGNKRTKK